MTSPAPFWRAAALALAWCLVGLGIDLGPGAAPKQPTANAQRPAWVPNQFASQRPSTNPPATIRVPTCPP